MSEPSGQQDYQHLVDAFRAPPRRRGLTPAERRLVAALSAYLVFAVWSIGTRDPWALWTALGLAALALACALAPRPDLPPPARPVRRLTRAPLFWLGLAFFGYILVQGFNPAFTFERYPTTWFLAPVEHVGWLPSGLRTPFDALPGTLLPQTNPFRQAVLLGAPWLATCAAWVGLTRRRAVVLVIQVAVVNAVLVGGVAALQQISGTPKMLWLYEPPYQVDFWGPFTYRNHAAAYFYLAFSAAAGLAIHAYHHARHTLRRAHAGPMWVLCAGILAVAIVLAGSRGGMILGAFVVAACAAVAITRFTSRTGGGSALPLRAAVAGLIVVVVLGAAVLFQSLRTPALDREFAALWELFDGELRDQRVHANRAAVMMWEDRPWDGWGAGSFRYVFPAYRSRIPELNTGPARYRPFWRDAHNDVLQTVVEVGILGTLPAFLILVSWIVAAVRWKAWEHPLAVCLLLGWAALFLHALLDFHWQSGAILSLWGLFPALALLHVRFEVPTVRSGGEAG